MGLRIVCPSSGWRLSENAKWPKYCLAIGLFMTEEQWAYVESRLRVERKNNRSRKRRNEREIFEALLFILHTGIQWKYLPKTFPPKSTAQDSLKLWSDRDASRKAFAKIIRSLLDQGRIELDERFVDTTFAPAKGGGESIGLTRKEEGTKLQLIVDKKGLSLSISMDATSTGEAHMAPQPLEFMDEEITPERLIGNKAYDSAPLDKLLAKLGIERIAPHRKNRKAKHRMADLSDAIRNDGPTPACCGQAVERFIAWLGNDRRLLLPWEKHAYFFFAFTTLATSLIAMRSLVEFT